MLIRTGQAAVAVTTVCAYPDGFGFTVRVHAPDELELESGGARQTSTIIPEASDKRPP